MRHSTRSSLLALLVVPILTGCGHRMSIEDARVANVVTVDGVSLDGATMEQLLLHGPAQIRPSAEAANVYVSAFIDAALLRRALVRATPLADSTMVAEAIAPDAERGEVLTAMQARHQTMPAVTDAQADSVARLGNARVFQHILVKADITDSTSTANAVKRLAPVLDALRNGADFDSTARLVSEDTATAASGGILPAATRSDLPPGPLGAAAWRLQPGEMAPTLLPSSAGAHIVRRVPLVEARAQFKAWLAPRFAGRADSLWVDSVSTAKHLQVVPGAMEATRALAREPYTTGSGSDSALATWDGGSLGPTAFATWLSIMPPVQRASLPMASDSVLTLLVRQVAQREMMWQVAANGGPKVSPAAWTALAPSYRQALVTLADSTGPALRGADSSAAVRQYMLAVAAGRIRFRPLPGALGAILRREATITIDQPAIDRIVQEAQLRFAPDSTNGSNDSGKAAGATAP